MPILVFMLAAVFGSPEIVAQTSSCAVFREALAMYEIVLLKLMYEVFNTLFFPSVAYWVHTSGL